MPPSSENPDPQLGFRSDHEMLAEVAARAARRTAARGRQRRLVSGGIAALVVAIVSLAVVAVNRDRGGDALQITGSRGTEVDPSASLGSTTSDPIVGDRRLTASGEWSALPDSPLSPRTRSISAWTGSELLIWGGEGYTTDTCRPADGGPMLCGDQARNDGAAFDPSTDSWRMLAPAPLPADQGSSFTYRGVWAGEELVVWGGPEAKGAAYDPGTDTWREVADGPLGPRHRFGMALTTGESLEVLVAGGSVTTGSRQFGVPDTAMSAEVAAYDPSTDSWRILPDLPEGRTDLLIVQPHESSPVVLGGYADVEADRSGDIPFPSTLRLGNDGWERLPPSPLGRVDAAIAYEDGVVVTGTDPGDPADPLPVSSAARLEPWTGTWVDLPVPVDEAVSDALWHVDGSVMLVPGWGDGFPGAPVPRQLLDLAGESPSGPDSWMELPLIGLFDGALDGVQGSAVAWTGSELLVWGGGADGAYGADPVDVGARFHPDGDG